MKKFTIILFLAYSALSCSAQQTINLNHWKFHPGDNLEWAKPGFDDSQWKPIKTGLTWDAQGYAGEASGWYRMKFDLPLVMKEKALSDSIRFFVGAIYDCDQTFLNGKLLGENTHAVRLADSENIKDITKFGSMSCNLREYIIPANDPRLSWGKENVLAIRVYCQNGKCGMYSLPDNTVRMMDASDYLTLDPDTKLIEVEPGGKLSKTIVLKNLSASYEIKGKLAVEVFVEGSKKQVASQSFDVNLQKGETPFTFSFKGDLLQKMKAVYTFTETQTGASLVKTRQIPGIELTSSDENLNVAFAWAKKTALGYAREGDPVGLWYEAALPGRMSFCARDMAHQSIGGYFLGLNGYNKNMLMKFAESATASKKWCPHWEIDKNGNPFTTNYQSDSDFWFCLPSNFDIMKACYDLYNLSGDTAYLLGEPFYSFHEHNVNEFVKAWDSDHDGIMDHRFEFSPRMVSASYAEGDPKVFTAADMLASQAKGYEVYARMMELQHKHESAKRYEEMAGKIRTIYEQKWWNDKTGRYSSYMGKDGKLSDNPDKWMSLFPLRMGFIKEKDRINKLITGLENYYNGGVEQGSYLPELFYRYNRPEIGYRHLLLMADPTVDRRIYPEVSYSFIGTVAEGLMGIELHTPENFIQTNPKLPKELDWVELKYIPWKTGHVTVKHIGLQSTTLTSGTGETFTWRAILPGNETELWVNNKKVKAKAISNFNDEPMVYTDVKVGPGESCTVSKAENN